MCNLVLKSTIFNIVHIYNMYHVFTQLVHV